MHSKRIESPPAMKSVFLLVLSLLFIRSVCSVCSNEAVRGPYRLVGDSLQLQDTEALEVEFVKFKIIEETENIHMFKAYRKSSYCYSGFTESCETKVEDIDVPVSELMKWARLGECCVNKNMVAPVSGAEANTLYQSGGRKLESETCQPKVFMNDTEQFIFAYHTYMDSFGCEYHKHVTPTNLECKSAGTCTIANSVTRMPGMSEMRLVPNLPIKKDGFTYAIFYDLRMRQQNVFLKCLSNNRTESEDKLICLDKEENMFVKDSTCEGNICYFSVGVKPRNNTLRGLAKSNAGSAAEVELLNHIEYLTDLSNFNIHLIDARMVKIESILINAINSLAKIDEMLIGNIIGTPMKTRYLGKESFESFACSEVTEDTSTTCKGDLIFKNGRWVQKDPEDVCLSYKKVSDLNLFGFKSLLEMPVVRDRLNFDDRNWDAWDFVANSMQDMIRTIEGTSRGGKGTGLEFVTSKTSNAFGIMYYYSFFASVLGSVGMPLLVVFVCICFIRR